jgi:hypothetical protein
MMIGRLARPMDGNDPPPEQFERLGLRDEAQRAIWQQLEADLSECVRKTDYRFQDEPHGQERHAWLRGSAAVSGSR